MTGPLRRYRRIAGYRIPVPLVGLLAIWWLANIIGDYRIEPDTDDQTEAALRLAQSTWAVAVETEDAPLWVQYLLLFDSSRGAKEECVEIFDELSEKNQLNPSGERALRTMRSFLPGITSFPSTLTLEQWKEDHEEQAPWSWETATLERQSGEDSPDWVQNSISSGRDFNHQIYRHWIAGVGLWLAAIIVGLPFFPEALRCFRSTNHLPSSPIPSVWHPSLLVGLLLLTFVVDEWFFGIAYMFLEPLGLGGSTIELIGLDAVWRGLGPLVFVIVCFTSWRHMGRLLRLDIAPQIKPILGMLPLVFAYDFALSGLFELLDLHDASDLPYLEEDGIDGLMLSITSAVILAPLMEEILFRGFLFQGLQKRNGFWFATLASTFFFVLIHLYGFYGSISVASFGIVACVLYRATGSLWTPIVYHAVTNGLITASTWPIYNGVYSDW